MTRLRIDHADIGYGDRAVCRDIDLDIPDGAVTVIVGPNACGKSTVLKALVRLLKPTAGKVLLDGSSISSLPTRDVARAIGLLPQQPVAPDGIRVIDLVARGRHPHQRLFSPRTPHDEEAIRTAMELTNTLDLSGRFVDELSGGQRQRVWMAVALAQETEILLLDEPTTYLDVSHQVELLELCRRLNRDRGLTVVAVLHDLAQAARYADHLIAMRDGDVVAAGSPRDVVTADLVRDVFGLDAVVVDDPESGTPLVVPRWRHGRE
ncbi:ABC transporter ATP-binding protein [Corynebacterium sp. 335C]